MAPAFRLHTMQDLPQSLQNSKFFYVLPVFPVLLGSGAVACERFSQKFRLRWPTWVVGVTMTVSGALLMPLAVPLLPVDQFVSYARTLGLWDAVRMEKNEGDARLLRRRAARSRV